MNSRRNHAAPKVRTAGLAALLITLAGATSAAAQVFWITSGNGLWTDPANWTSFPALPGPADNVLIDRASDPRRPPEGWLVTLSSGSQHINSLLLLERLQLSGSGTTLRVNNIGEVNNQLLLGQNTILRDGFWEGVGFITANGGGARTLDNITLNTSFIVPNLNRVNITNDLTLTSFGSVSVNHTSGAVETGLFFSGNQSILGSGEILLNSTSSVFARIVLTTNGGSLTIAPGTTVRTGPLGGGAIDGSSASNNATLINQGTLGAYANTNNRALGVGGQTNTSGLRLGSFINEGVAEVGPGGTLELNALTWSNTLGQIIDNGGTINLSGTVLTSNLGTILRNGGTLNLIGTLDNTGDVFDAETTGTIFLRPNSTIIGGGVISSGPATIDISGGGQRTLNGVTLGTALVVPNLNRVNITNDLELADSSVSVNHTSGAVDTGLFFSGNQSILGSGEILLNSTSSVFARLVLTTNGGSLTIAPGITIRTGPLGGGAIDGTSVSSNATLINQGTLGAYANTNNRALGVGGQTNTSGLRLGSFINEGVVEAGPGGTLELNALTWSNTLGQIIDNGGTINLSGTVLTSNLGTILRNGGTLNLIGTLDNTGDVFDAETTGTIFLRPNSTIIGGGVISSGPATVDISGGGQRTLNGVTLGTTLAVPNTNRVNITNDLMMDNGTVSVNHTAGAIDTGLFFSGDQAILGSGEVLLNSTASAFARISLTTSAGSLTIAPGITIRTGPLGGGSIDGISSNSATLINQGTIGAYANTNNRPLSVGGQTNASPGRIASFINDGIIEAGSGGVLELNAVTSTNNAEILADGGIVRLFNDWTNNDLIRIRPGGTVAFATAGTFAPDSLVRFEGVTADDNNDIDFGLFNIQQPITFAGALEIDPDQTTNFIWTDEYQIGTITGSGSVVADFEEFIFPVLDKPELRWYREITNNAYIVGVTHFADINRDGVINADDLGILLGSFGSTVPTGTGADLNNDGIVNADDLGILLGAFGLSAEAYNARP